MLRSFFESRWIRFCGLTIMAVSVWGQTLDPRAQRQINDILAIKNGLTDAQRKVSTDLLFAKLAMQRAPLGSVSDAVVDRSMVDAQGTVVVDIKGQVSTQLTNRIQALGGNVVNSFHDTGFVRASMPLANVEALATGNDVSYIRTADIGRPNVGSVTSQGYISHAVNSVVGMGVTGNGVKIGVLSSSATAARVAALIASGDLPSDVTVVPGQDGFTSFGATDDEGTAMMEIIHDIAPNAKLFFATAYGGQANFANNIRLLRNTYGCDIIVDDFTYFAEGAFQDGTVAKAVNEVTASGALYFSSAANSGNLSSGTSGTWEGDYVDGGPVAGVISDNGETGNVHLFGTDNYNILQITSSYVSLKWSDPLGGSTNDYDLFILDGTGTQLKGFSVGAQTGTQDPFEAIPSGYNCGFSDEIGYCPYPGDRVVVVKFSGQARALRIDTNRGKLSNGTAGSTFGHNAGLNTVSMAATSWNSGHVGTKPFSGAANPVETFSSDGPRKMFFNPDGSAITDGNFLFGTNGGITLAKPDLTAADGVFTKTPGFLPFFGTSAAAPHAAGVAALIKSANPSLTAAQILSAMKNTALDSMAPGVDRDAGSGIVMALPAVLSVLH